MYISYELSHMLGIVFIVLGLSIYLNKAWTAIVIDEFTKSQGLIWLAGLITVMLGAFLVVTNNLWISGLPIVITVIGWLTLLKGATILIFPNFSINYYKKINTGKIFTWGGIIIFILGLLLIL